MFKILKLQILGILCLAQLCHAQLDVRHFIPPIYYGLAEGGSDKNNFDRHYLVLSTPSIAPVDVLVKDGAENVIINTQISNANPLVHILGRLDESGVYNSSDPGGGSGNVVGTSQLNTKVTDGLFVEATSEVYANIRHQSGYQGGSLTSKGSPAFGSEFRVATMRNNDVMNQNYLSLFFSVMAVEDDTVVTIDQIKPGVVFTDTVASGNPLTSEDITVVLQKGESYVVGIKADTYTAQGGTASLNEVNGTRLLSSKPVVMNSGTVLGTPDRTNVGSRDMGFDQIAPVTRGGREYIFVKGGATNGSDLETVTIVAVEDNTNIFVGNELAPYNSSPMMAGDYAFIAGKYTSNGTMYLRSNRGVLAWQTIAGSNSAATPGFNFVPPLNTDIATSVDNIAEIDLIGEATINIVGRVGHPVTINGNAPTVGPMSVDGTDEWVVYSQSGLTDNPKVESTGAIAVSLAMLKNPIGAAAYYSGYPTFKPLIVSDSVCPNSIPGAVLRAVDPSGGIYTNFEWYHESGASTGVFGSEFIPTIPGDYYIEATSGSDLAPSATSALYTVNQAAESDLEIVKTVDKEDVGPGDFVKFTITLTNHGPDTAEDIEVSTVASDGYIYIDGSIEGGDYNSDVDPTNYGLAWAMESLSAEAGSNSVEFSYYAYVNVAGDFGATAQILSCVKDDDLSNNSSLTSVEVTIPENYGTPEYLEDCCDKETYIEFNIRDVNILENYSVYPASYDAARDVWNMVKGELNCNAQGLPLEEEKRGFQEEDFYIGVDSEVIVTVIHDGGNNYNTIAFYDASDPEATWKTIWESFVTGPTAPLIPGSSASLGIIPADTELRFGLVMDGGRGGIHKIYQDAYLNPAGLEMTASNLFLEQPNRPLIIAFEDLLFEGRDNDFNDVILKVDIIPTTLGTAQYDNVIANTPGQNSDRGSRGVRALLENFGMNSPSMELTAELFAIPQGLTQLTIDLIDDRNPTKFTLGAVEYDKVQLVNPTSLEFREIAGAEGVVFIDDRAANVGDSVVVNPSALGLDGKVVMLFVVPNNTLDKFNSNPWRYTPKGDGDTTKRQPLFSLNNANPESRDQFLAFSDSSTTLLAIEDFSRTLDTIETGELSNNSFDDIQLQISPALTPISFHNGIYFDGSEDVTAGFQGDDGYTEQQHGGY